MASMHDDYHAWKPAGESSMDIGTKAQIQIEDTRLVSVRSEWLSVSAVALGAFALVTTEFLPVGLLPEIANSLDVSLGSAGLMLTAPGFIATLAAPLILVGTGRMDRRSVMLILSGLLLFSNVLAAVAPNFLVLLIARALLGICLGGFWTVALATTGSLVQSKHSARAVAVVFSAVTAATIVGVPVGTYFGSISTWRVSFFVTAVLVGIGFAGQAAFLPTLKPRSRQQWSDIRAAVGNRGIQMALLATSLIIAAHLAAYTYVAPYLINIVKLSSFDVPYVLLAFGAVGFVANLSAPYFMERFPFGSMVTLVTLFAVSFFVLMFVARSLALTAVVLVVWAICNGAILLSLNSWVLRRSTDHAEAGSALFVSTVQIGIAFGAISGGYVVDAMGIPANFGFAFLLAVATAFPLFADPGKLQ